AQDGFVANDLEVVANVCSGWNEGEKAGDERRAPYAVKQVAITKDLGERDQVDCLSCIPKIDENVVNRPVRRNVKIIFVNFLDAFCNSLSRRNKHRAHDAMLL